jgi:hypothetical protein
MNVLLLIGSPKVKQSNSEALGDCLLGLLDQEGVTTRKIKIYQALKEEKGMEELLSSINTCEALILLFPLYVDSLPSGVIKVMEAIAAQRSDPHSSPPRPGGQTFMAICNSGFPEAEHNDTALAICRCFAEKTGLQWLGGLPLGGGEAIGGKPLTSFGGMFRKQINALKMAAEAIVERKKLPAEAVALFRKPSIPRWLYVCCGHFGWRRQARENGVLKRIREQPYK